GQMIAVTAYKKALQEAAIKPVAAPKNPTTVPSTVAKPWVDAMIAHAGAQIADRDQKGAVETLTAAEALATAAKLSEPTGTGATTRPVSTRLKDAITALKDNK